jgi:hypothetical protein
MRCLILILILGLFLLPTVAQDETPTPYEIALQRIEEARVSGTVWLDLSRLGLTELPPEIGNLINLGALGLSHNELNSIPPEIGSLSNLESLDLAYNQLTSLPPEIGQLVNLDNLVLYKNHLISIPPEIGQLVNLQELFLDHNELTGFPPEIGQLTNLCALTFLNNHITHLPTEFRYLKNLGRNNCRGLYIFYYEDNPLVSPPAEVMAQGIDAIMAYLQNEAWWHLQRLIAGGAGAVGIVVAVVLGLRWRNRRGYEKKKKG